MGDYPSKKPLSSPSIPPKSTVIDLTHPLISNEVPACDGHPSYKACCVSSIANGALSNVHSLTLGTHTGTHIDSPYHFFDDGVTVDRLDLSLLTAVPAVVVDLRSKKARERIDWDDLKEYEGRLHTGAAVLLCTGWSRNWCKTNYSDHPYLGAEAAKRILEKGVKVLGVDTMSPDAVTQESGDSGIVHRVVLGNGGVIVENLRGLEDVLESGIRDEDIMVSLLPLKLEACDGSPIRAVAWSKQSTI